MLGASNYYYQIVRKCTVGFGNIFKDIILVKYNANTRTELERRIVPLIYSAKENYIKRILQAPNLPNPVEVKLPTMSFEMTGIQYDPNRKLQSSLINYNQISGNPIVSSQYTGVPYNINFSLYIYIRNIDDGLQIIEQILPFFTPDYTLTLDLIEEMGITKSLPIVLNNVSVPTEYEGDATDTERRLVWSLDFTVQANFFGPITTGGGPITETIVNFKSLQETAQLDLTVANTALGNFAVGETVYQGTSLAQANAVGQVIAWNPAGNTLTVSLTSGTFVTSANVYGVNYGSSVQVTSIPNGIVYATVIDTPVPNNAGLYGDFGFTEQIIEFPDAGDYVAPNGSNGGTFNGGSGSSGGGTGGYGGNYQVDIYANGVLVLSNGTIGFNNSNTINVSVASNSTQAALMFSVNTSALNIAAGGNVSAAYAQANAAYGQANFAYGVANMAWATANLAYAQANLAVINVSSGNTLNLVVSGNATNITIDTRVPAGNSGNSTNNYSILTATYIYTNTINMPFGDFTSISGTTTANGTAVTIDSFSASTYNTVKYLIQLTTAAGLQSTEILCMQDGVNTYMTEYGTLISSSLIGTFSSTITGGNFILNFTPNNPSLAIITFKVIREAVTT